MSDEAVPPGWEPARLEELVPADAPIVYGIIQAGPHVEDGVPYVRPTEMRDDAIAVEECLRTSPEIAAKYHRAALRPDDVVMSIVGTIGKVALVPPELDGGNLNQSAARIRPPDWMPPAFLKYALKSPQLRQQFAEHEFGLGVRRLNLSHARALEVNLPPLNEQRRIVEKIEALMARSRRAKEALDAIPPLLERFRQSVLAAAFRGDLTADWRAQNPDVEPADQLLERIRAERRRRWEEDYLAKQRAKGKEPKNDKWKAKYKEPERLEPQGLPSLPAGWSWSALEQLCIFVTDGDHNPPKRVADGIPHLTAKHVKRWSIGADGCTFLTPEGFEKTRKRYEPLRGDVIVTCVGTLGECAVVPEGFVFSADRNLAGARLVREGIPPRLVMFALSRPRAQIEMLGASGSTAQPHVYLSDLRRVAVPVPPPAEQEPLLARIEECMARLDLLEDSFAEAVHAHGRLDQATLAKAFRGELVPQDPDDEPASVLLERIRAEREVAPSRKKRGRKPKATR